MKSPAAGENAFLAQLRAGVVRILVVDDDLHICLGLKDILQDAGYEVETAVCAAEAYEHLDLQTFALAIVDYSLPDANGIEIARKVHGSYPWMQTILMTGHDRVEIAMAEQNPPLLSALLRKPIDVQTILNVIEQTLQRQCDRYKIARFSPRVESVPVYSPPSTNPVLKGNTFTSPIEAVIVPASATWTLTHLAILGLALVAGFTTGWFCHARRYKPEVEKIAPVQKDAVPVKVPVAVPVPMPVSVPVSSPAVTSVVAEKTPEPVKSPPPARKPRVVPVASAPPPAPPPEPDWETQLESADFGLRLSAAKALLKSSPNHEQAVSVLLTMMQDTDPVHRLAAVEAISVSGLSTSVVVQALGAALVDNDLPVAYAAVGTLAHIGEAALPAFPQLLAVLPDRSRDRISLGKQARAVILHSGSAVVPLLIEKLKDVKVRGDVIETLGAMGPAAQDALPALTALESDPDVGSAAAKAGTQIKPATP